VHELTEGTSTPDLLELYARVDRRGRRGRWVFANMVCGIDGTAAFGGRVGPLSTGEDRELFVQMRSLADVVLVGAETVRRERYGPVRLTGPRAASSPDRPPPPIAVVTRSLDLDWTLPLFRADDSTPGTSRPIVITCGAAPKARLVEAHAHASVIVAGERKVQIGAALAALATLGHGVVLCEGGPTLLGELVQQELLDELCLTIAPIMGGDPLPVAVLPGGALPTDFTLRHVAKEESMLFLRYERARPH
jgi:riboflavin biosynthesis pyrimidine reductase